eukprot:TRINITY_DN4296_c4_g1_i2.p1 TRINITY_DN4296_c4_g1~~TRINITY_DN4296_c4_g1_i2.p1  ORF type:complete len:252 (+),score=54.09 TRINITY_DN4296_c4_g1_i2:143-898(+)
MSNFYECSLHGVFDNEKLDLILNTLKAITSGDDNLEKFNNYESIWKAILPTNDRNVTDLTLVCEIDETGEEIKEYTLKYIGEESIKNRQTAPILIRAYLPINVSSNMIVTLPLIGYKIGYEYVKKGYRFKDEHNIEINVFYLNKLRERGNYRNIDILNPSSNDISSPSQWIIELLTISNEQNVKIVQQHLENLSTRLSSIVKIEKVKVHELSSQSESSLPYTNINNNNNNSNNNNNNNNNNNIQSNYNNIQ